MTSSTLSDFSNALADAAARAGESTLLVDSRRRFPASGIALAADLVLTADHVVEREEDLAVMLPDGSRLAAKLAGRDPGSDLALLRLEQGAATPAEFVAEEPRVGQIVLALGRPAPEGIQASLGVISALAGPAHTGHGNRLERYFRSDVTLLPGFSGGPLVDSAGRVLGLNTSGFGAGTAITIPASLARRTAEILAQHGRIRRGYLGIRSQAVELPATVRQTLGNSQNSGLLLVSVEADSPAAQGGLMIGDILISLAGKAVSDHESLMSCLSGDVVGKAIPAIVLRGGQPSTLSITVGEQ